jgi:hypothetical protein
MPDMPRQIMRESTVVVTFDRESDAEEFRAGTDGLMRDLKVMGIRCDVGVNDPARQDSAPPTGRRAAGGR